MDQFVFIDNKAYRKGYTTGSCAAAAAKVATQMLLEKQLIEQVTLITPTGVKLDLDVLEASLTESSATAAIRKDGGDDIDVTHGMLIFAQVSFNETTEIHIDGGEGIGRITRPGIRRPLGTAAINDVPRQMITAAVREVIGEHQGVDILIFAPEGEIRANQTYNPKLGIMGGISILGTTGIVTPMSDESWKKSIALDIADKQAQGIDRLIFVPGNYGEKFAEQLGMNARYVVIMSNFIRYVLKECERLGIQRVLFLGHLGKLIKIAAGIFHTHSHIADGRFETLIAQLALLGAPITLLQQIDQCTTTEAAMTLIAQAEFNHVYFHITQRIKEKAEQLSKYTASPIQIDAIVCTMDGTILASSQPIDKLVKEFRL